MIEKNIPNKLFPVRESAYKGLFFILGMKTQDNEFLLGIQKGNIIVHIGTFSKGLKKSERNSLIEAINKNQNTSEHDTVSIEPAICVEIYFKTIVDNQLVDPNFHSFQLNLNWYECTWDRLLLDNNSTNIQGKITHPDKTIWETPFINKESYISYLIQVSSYILPFLRSRALTTIRYPHGVPGESFYQKNCPEYAPSFVNTVNKDGINYIVCNDSPTLHWLGNQMTIEYHVPFQTVESNNPLEIVFDLDPPNKAGLPLAIKAAIEMKKIFDKFEIISYPKLSGSKGLQIHIPIIDTSLTYDETRVFTEFIAKYLVEKYPNSFTIERLKKNRGKKLYIDYIQHAEGKTIICPYSPRGRENATVAAPLFWDEVNENLKIERYNVPFVLDRLSNNNCPFGDFFEQTNSTLKNIIVSLKTK
ncbi:DNA ligase D [Virgibacillus byunsanensis]|uniref:DNA ligase D n=1 Tax=Virgibacillus byunsanensis TaxID=570945 RepID=A0ABW3LEY0_9BACI